MKKNYGYLKCHHISSIAGDNIRIDKETCHPDNMHTFFLHAPSDKKFNTFHILKKNIVLLYSADDLYLYIYLSSNRMVYIEFSEVGYQKEFFYKILYELDLDVLYRDNVLDTSVYIDFSKISEISIIGESLKQIQVSLKDTPRRMSYLPHMSEDLTKRIQTYMVNVQDAIQEDVIILDR